ncbi:hypothetical protein QR680_018036 [Steinernema hermaphroditum]|uniref:7TM GPCR serpentine receptor class x (Srx) domain-containing protein n=1 Tax=Steinernema hermaphroditum TaxID=289476 RepID=A0AA39HHZ9_9BILA|nr:hypothetical protein QR680_018036 [Steinernema hermaphroditum]
MDVFHRNDFQAGCHLLASALSFVGSFRTLWIILTTKFYRKQKSFQIMANVNVMECVQMIICFLGGIVVLDENIVSRTMNRALGALLMAVWIGLVYMRLVLAINRFATITQYKRTKLLNTTYFHWGSIIVCWLFMIGSTTVCLIRLDVLYMNRDISTWDYYDFEAPFRYFDRFSSLFTVSVGFSFYIYTWGFIMKHKKHDKSSDIRLFFAFAGSFCFEIGNILSFNVVPHFFALGNDAFRIMTVCWILVPAFNALMLLSINGGFRQRFFSILPVKVTTSVFMRRSSSRSTPSGNNAR